MVKILVLFFFGAFSFVIQAMHNEGLPTVNRNYLYNFNTYYDESIKEITALCTCSYSSAEVMIIKVSKSLEDSTYFVHPVSVNNSLRTRFEVENEIKITVNTAAYCNIVDGLKRRIDKFEDILSLYN